MTSSATGKFVYAAERTSSIGQYPAGRGANWVEIVAFD